MQRFFVQENQINMQDKTIEIIGEDVNHIKNVLRCKIGEQIEVCSKDTNNAYLCEISNIKQNIETIIIKELENNKESALHINIIQGLPKSDKMDLIIQKGTELGVKEFTPLALKRCVVKIDSKDEQKKILKWQKQAEVAAKQCGRDIIPKVNNIYSINTIYNLLDQYDLILLAYENEKENTLRSELEKVKNNNAKIAVIIGPEGGLEETEVEKLKQNGAKVISLGNRILRTETVAMVVTSVLQYALRRFISMSDVGRF